MADEQQDKPEHGKLFFYSLVAAAFTGLIAFAGSQNGNTVTVAGLDVPILMLCAAIAMGINWLVFLPSYLAQTEHYYDLTGSLSFITVTLTTLVVTPDLDTRSMLLATLILLWTLRLGSFLFLRIKKDGADTRFDTIKPVFSRFFLTWTLQGLWVFVTSAAALAAITNGIREPLGILAWVGLAVWVAGMLIEMTADIQKRQFKANPDNKGRFITSGIWSWSRHPNYFGEITLWFGVALIALPVLSGWQFATLISPVFVTVLLTKISGVPLLEKKADKRWGDEAEYQAYKQRTSVLIPMPPKG
jgi:steroid 5-alpha reductase family enzyme